MQLDASRMSRANWMRFDSEAFPEIIDFLF
jgi:hypothetical protein